MPVWLKRRVSAVVKARKIPHPGWLQLSGWNSLQHAAVHLGSDWIDHAGRLRLAGGVQILVSEPYGLTDRAETQLQEFCRILGLEYEIQDRSWWFPNNTIRIVVREVAE